MPFEMLFCIFNWVPIKDEQWNHRVGKKSPQDHVRTYCWSARLDQSDFNSEAPIDSDYLDFFGVDYRNFETTNMYQHSPTPTHPKLLSRLLLFLLKCWIQRLTIVQIIIYCFVRPRFSFLPFFPFLPFPPFFFCCLSTFPLWRRGFLLPAVLRSTTSARKDDKGIQWPRRGQIHIYHLKFKNRDFGIMAHFAIFHQFDGWVAGKAAHLGKVPLILVND